MKKLKLVSVFFSLLMFISFTFVPVSNAAVVDIGDAELKCKVEIIDCPGWGTGDRQICHQNGTGLNCTCGESTNCGDKTEVAEVDNVTVR